MGRRVAARDLIAQDRRRGRGRARPFPHKQDPSRAREQE